MSSGDDTVECPACGGEGRCYSPPLDPVTMRPTPEKGTDDE